MNRLAFGCALALALSIPSLASADSLSGTYEMTGRYNNRRNTAVSVRVESAGWNKYRVIRKAKFTSSTYRHLPEFTWNSEIGQQHGNLLIVRYSLGASTSSGIAGGLSGNPSDRAMLRALAQGNEIRAIYKFSDDRSKIREVVLNTTRRGDQSWWRSIKANGDAVVEGFRPTTAPGRLSQAEFDRKTLEHMRQWYRDHLRDGYESELADASTAAERAQIRANWDSDKADDPAADAEGDELWEDNVEYQYDDGEPYRDANDAKVPYEDVVVVGMSFYTELAGIGLSKTFVFDRHTGEVLEEGDIQD
jgi:hypothetical protein